MRSKTNIRKNFISIRHAYKWSSQPKEVASSLLQEMSSRTFGAVVTKGIRRLNQVIFPTLEVLLFSDGFSPSEFEKSSVTCWYDVQQLEFLAMKPRGPQSCTSRAGLFVLNHGYPRDGLPGPKSGYCGQGNLWVFPNLRRHECETIRQQEVIKGTPMAALLPLFPSSQWLSSTGVPS